VFLSLGLASALALVHFLTRFSCGQIYTEAADKGVFSNSLCPLV
jgi:hypothetical protein